MAAIWSADVRRSLVPCPPLSTMTFPAVPAILARKMDAALLTHAMEERHQIGLDSYDRFFPNQDTMPKGGFGNLIALPLQGGPRREGNSVFLNDQFEPHLDQWAFLSGLQRMTMDQVASTVTEAERTGGIIGLRLTMTDDDDAEDKDPWSQPPSGKKDVPINGPLPQEVRVVRGNLASSKNIHTCPPFSGTRSFKCCRNAPFCAYTEKRGGILLPAVLVEISGQKKAALVWKQRINADC